MLRLDFLLSDASNSAVDHSQISNLSDIDLRFSIAFGDFTMIINEVDCSAPWGWIPLIDMAVVLCEIRDKLKSRDVETEVFDFTENDATITFEKTSEFLRITTNYGPVSQLVQFLEFDNQVTKFRENVFAAALNLIPSLENNNAFQSLQKRSFTER